MNIIAPEILTQRLARRAVEIAQITGPRKSGKALNSLIALSQPGIIGIEVPDETAYLLDLERGIKEHAMVDLSDRVIPIRNTDGTISFRSASAQKIGSIPIITRSSKSGKIYSGKREWVYPRKPPLSFLQKSLQRSVDEWKRTVTTKEIVDMLLRTEAKDDISMLVYGRPVL